MKKIFCIILTLILWVSLCMPVFGADKAEGTTIRLTKAEGNGVSVTTNGDKALKVAENMRLFSGYRVITDKNSFAYLSLDDSKAVKLDKNTKVKIVKQGNKNQVSVSTGKLFFNVSKKLAPDESMEVQASNVSMGIRGTSGELTTTLYANAKSGEPESRTELQLFEGTLDVKITNSKTGEIEIYHMVDGTKIDVLTYKDQAAVDVLVTLLTAGDLSSSAINEILSDPRLSALVEEGSGFTHEALKKAAEDAANRETEEQARRELEEKTAQSQSGSQTNITTEAPPETKPDRGGGSDPAPSTPPPLVLTGTNLTDADLTEAFLENAEVHIGNGSTLTIARESTNIPAGKSLTIDQDATLNLSISLVVSGTLTNNDTLNLTNGDVILKDNAGFSNSGTVNGTGSIIVSGANVQVSNCTGSTLTGIIIAWENFTMKNQGTITTLEISSDNDNTAITVNGTIGTLINSGNSSTVTNDGVITTMQHNKGALTVSCKDGSSIVAIIGNTDPPPPTIIFTSVNGTLPSSFYAKDDTTPTTPVLGTTYTWTADAGGTGTSGWKALDSGPIL